MDVNHPTSTNEATCLPKNTLVCRTESIHSNTSWLTMSWSLCTSFKMKYNIICRTALESNYSSGPAWLEDRDDSLSIIFFFFYVCYYMTEVSEWQHSFTHRNYRFCSTGHMLARLSALPCACTSSSTRKNRVLKGREKWRDTVCMKCIQFKARIKSICKYLT